MPRKLRFAVAAALLVLLAVSAGSARAAVRMPIGFYDDASFRWSTVNTTNLEAAQKANASIIHVLADWSQIAPIKPASPLNGNDPAYKLDDLDTLIETAQKYDLQVLLTISQTPKWANGGQTPNHPPTNLADLTQFSQMLALRYNGKHAGLGSVTRFSVWNEPNLAQFLTPQFQGSTIVSPATYAKIYAASYKGIKAGNPKALVAIGETSNRGRNHPSGGGSDSVAPATFAHLLSIANPKLQFDAWATHPYPTVFALGPTQKVAYPNVALSTMTQFGADLQKWFGRRVPIWITEYAEMTKPEYAGGVSYSQQATDAKKALQIAAQNPYVEMFIWFIFRDGTALPADSALQTWYSGIETKAGKKKPAYAAFAAAAKSVVGQSQIVSPGKTFPVSVAVPVLTYSDILGSKVGVEYTVYDGKKIVASGDPQSLIGTNQSVTFTVKFDPARGKSYSMNVLVTDRHGQFVKRVVALLPSP